MCPDPCSLKDCEGDSKGLPGVMGLSQAGEGRVGVFLILRSLRLIRGQNNLGTNSRCPPARRTQPRGDVGGPPGTSNGLSCEDPRLGVIGHDL